jgi:short-subunit dehydrogenase
MALTRSMHHELAAQGIRVQAVLPGATATDFWDTAGMAHTNLPEGWVMRTEDMVDAALAGLEQGEVVTIPPLQDGAGWTDYEAARKALSQVLHHATPGPLPEAGSVAHRRPGATNPRRCTTMRASATFAKCAGESKRT